MPRTLGHSFIHYSALDYVVENVNEPLPVMKFKPPSDVETKIGQVIAGLVPDGATLQMGIGNFYNNELGHSSNQKDPFPTLCYEN